MGRDEDRDDLGVERDRRKLEEGIPKEGPPVSQMASTYGSSLVTSEEQAERLADEEGDKGQGSPDGLGRPQPPPESSGH